jgi:hypothetical protein
VHVLEFGLATLGIWSRAEAVAAGVIQLRVLDRGKRRGFMLMGASGRVQRGDKGAERIRSRSWANRASPPHPARAASLLAAEGSVARP